jgi:hypothetical protein
MVQAFRDYCIDTEPARLLAVPPKAPGKWNLSAVATWGDGRVEEVHTLSLIELFGDPHKRLSLRIVLTNGLPRTCAVDAVWPEKSEIIRALAASVALEAAPALETERDYEVIRWKTRAHGASAVVELRVPIYAAKPGRRLTLVLAN